MIDSLNGDRAGRSKCACACVDGWRMGCFVGGYVIEILGNKGTVLELFDHSYTPEYCGKP